MPKKEDDLIEDAICRNCESLFQDGDNNYKCYSHSEQGGGNKLIYGLNNGSEVNGLDEHCSVFSKAIKKLSIKKLKTNTTSWESFSKIVRLDSFQLNVEMFWEKHKFFYDKANMFWLWDNGKKKYEMVDDVDMMILLDKVLGFEGQTVSSNLKSQYLEAFKRVGRINIPKEAPKKWIQFKDRAFSLKSGKIYDITPDYFFTNPIQWVIGDNEETPVMDKLIREWVGDKYIKTAYEIIAYCCLADYPIHLIFCLVGCGRNGKSKFLGLINKFIGSDNICSTELDVLLDSRFESFKLYKKLVCSMGETNFGVLSKTSLLKKLTGQDLIGFEFKNKRPFDDYNYAKIIISSNSLPTTEDTSEGFYRRWLIIDFPNIFPEGKDILDTIPKQEYSNLAKKVINILPKLLKVAKFTHQGSIEERRERYIMASNPLSLFIEFACKREYEAFMRYSELYIAYRQYLNEIKRRAISYREFNDVLALEGLEVQRTSKKIGDDFVSGRFINGVRLKTKQEIEGELKDMSIMSNVQKNVPTFITYKAKCKYLHKRHNWHKDEVTEELPITDSEPIQQKIHLPCVSCGTNPSNYYNKQGQPLCSTCYKSREKVK